MVKVKGKEEIVLYVGYDKEEGELTYEYIVDKEGEEYGIRVRREDEELKEMDEKRVLRLGEDYGLMQINYYGEKGEKGSIKLGELGRIKIDKKEVGLEKEPSYIISNGNSEIKGYITKGLVTDIDEGSIIGLAQIKVGKGEGVKIGHKGMYYRYEISDKGGIKGIKYLKKKENKKITKLIEKQVEELIETGDYILKVLGY